MKQIRVGIAGFGLSGQKFHLPLLNARTDYRVTHIASSRPEEVQRSLPGANVVASVEALAAAEIELVVIALPTFLHHEAALCALAGGKHVVVEKPFTVSTREADELIEAAHAARKILSVYQNRRWDSDFLTVRQLVESGRLGKLEHFHSRYLRFRPKVITAKWKEQECSGAGALYELGSHLIDQALCLFGLPEEVAANVRKVRSGALVDDAFDLTLRYKDFHAKLCHSALVEETAPRFLLRGGRGEFRKHGSDVQEQNLATGLSPTDDRWGREPQENFGVMVEQGGRQQIIPSERGRWLKFYEQLSPAVAGLLSPPVTVEEARAVIAVIEAAQKSSQLGGTAIPLAAADKT